jgi:hypothetical protein
MKAKRHRWGVPAIVLALLLEPALLRCADADAEAPAACANQTSNFDGTKALAYAVVKGKDAHRLSLHPEYPSKCRSPDEGACKGVSYVIPGDTVAIGTTCDAWSYVQCLGKKNISVGWVRTNYLTPSKLAPPSAESDRSLKSAAASSGEMDTAHYQFELTRGAETPVCQAF